MQISQISLLVASVAGLVNGLVLPTTNSGTSSVLKARDAATEFGDIVARAFVCPAQASSCTDCPAPEVKDGTCPVGAVCKRSPVEDGDNDIRSLDARASVPFDTIRSGTWTPGKVIETAGLSVCSVMAVYDQNKWVMAHIPPSRASGGVLTVTGQDVIDEYKAGMTTKYNAAGMTGAQGYLLVSNLLDVSEQNSMQQWFNQNGINVIVQLYTPDQAFVGSGNFVISREAVAWPPIVTLT